MPTSIGRRTSDSAQRVGQPLANALPGAHERREVERAEVEDVTGVRDEECGERHDTRSAHPADVPHDGVGLRWRGSPRVAELSNREHCPEQREEDVEGGASQEPERAEGNGADEKQGGWREIEDGRAGGAAPIGAQRANTHPRVVAREEGDEAKEERVRPARRVVEVEAARGEGDAGHGEGRHRPRVRAAERDVELAPLGREEWNGHDEERKDPDGNVENAHQRHGCHELHRRAWRRRVPVPLVTRSSCASW
jgi:hypothetical protein